MFRSLQAGVTGWAKLEQKLEKEIITLLINLAQMKWDSSHNISLQRGKPPELLNQGFFKSHGSKKKSIKKMHILSKIYGKGFKFLLAKSQVIIIIVKKWKSKVCVWLNFVPVTPWRSYFELWNFSAYSDCLCTGICCFIFAIIHYFLRTSAWLC